MISREDIEHMGWLARIELSDEAKEEFMPQLNSILEFFNQLDEVDTEDVEPTYHALGITNVFREDGSEDGIDQNTALSNTAKEEDGYFKGPRMI